MKFNPLRFSAWSSLLVLGAIIVALLSAGVVYAATETLWGTAQACGYAITNPANSVDGATNGFDGLVATCTGKYAQGNGSWTYTGFEATTFSTVTDVTVDISFYFSGWANDAVTLQISNDSGGTWTDLELFDAGNPPPLALTTNTYVGSIDFPTLFTTPAEVTAAQVRFIGTTRVGGADTISINLDAASLTVDGTGGNTAPTVIITAPPDTSTYASGTSITFTGTATDLEDGDLAASLAWASDLDGVIGSGGSFSISTLTVGVHTITASVTDSGGSSGSDVVTITVTADAPPIVTITAPANASSFSSGTTINFTGTATDAEDGNLTAVLAWTSDLDGAIGSGGSFAIATLSVGVHTITASVTDSASNTGSNSITVTITGDIPPVVTITAPANGSNFGDGVFVNFTATAVDNEDGNISASLTWTSDLDGVIGSGGSFSIVTLSIGTHTITAATTDSGGNGGNDSIILNIIANTTPLVTITAPTGGSNFPSGSNVNFTGTASDTEDGDISASLTWTSSLDGAIGAGNAFSSLLSDGVHTIRTQTTDSGGATGFDSILIVVGPFPNPHGSYSATTDDCARCHRSHTAQSPRLITPAVTGNAFCYTCHDGSGSSLMVMSTHSNVDYGAAAEANFELSCTQCHEPHGHASNLSAIREDVRVTMGPLVTTGPIVLTAATGTDSFDELDAVDNDDLCAACHENANNPGFPMSNHTGGDHTATGWGDQRGTDCTQCHGHDLDNNSATKDGFMPLGCTGCHSSPQDNMDGFPIGGRVAIVNQFSATSHHVQGVVQEADCRVCHDMTTHTNGFVELVQPDTGAILTESGSGNFRTANITAVDNSTLTTFCAGCHDGNGATRLGGSALTPFTGASNPAVVSLHGNNGYADRQEGVFTSGCAQCHESHGSNNLANIKETILVAPGTTTGAISYQATTGVDSLDEIDSPENNANNVDDLCVTCHINASNIGTPMADHVGGDHTTGGNDERGSNCIGCHKHDLDNDPATEDGLMAAAGGNSCVSCHAIVQNGRRQVVDSNGDGSGTGGDFLRASHHVNGLIPNDADCEVCHDQSQHQAGTVRLFNADNIGTVYLLDGVGDDADWDGFCSSCHDNDGALAQGGIPFSDGATPPVVDASMWSGASHRTDPAVGSCVRCHDNGHGSNKIKLLAPWNFTDDGDPDDGMREEERFCYSCHSSAGVAASDVESQFAPAPLWVTLATGENGLTTLNDRHDFATSVQAVSGTKMECVNCHNPHADNAANKLIADPDPTDGRVPGSGYVAGANLMTDWCMDCHDGSYPATVTPPTSDVVDILGSYGAAGNTHGAGSGGVGTLEAGWGWSLDITMQCMDCHVRHISGATPVTGGGSNLFHVKVLITGPGGSPNIPDDGGGFDYEITNQIKDDNVNGYDWCQTCHEGSMGGGGKKENCYSCHYHGLSGKF